ncbi:MAG: hypothetical protein PHY74_00320 [Candidatus Bathyarchaeota archaeon]|jgi:hypothetical protein|nr:hypothetical protein [Candidatus Bathyarchaeota archaeon]MDD4324878.1 hypothetical protein [Candidatus Bathyarchaeota archaeon]MDI9577485.1 hypothetical protein [Thermoproteota archaeon]NLD65817.1 hypothetical protein [Thermoproteota archaeon]
MKKSIYIFAVAVIAVAVLAGLILFQPAQQPQNKTYSFDFEDGLSDWTTDSDVPEDPNRPGQLINWTIDSANNISYSGNKSLLFYIDGLQDDGTIWIKNKFSTDPNTIRNVTVSFQFWSETESFNELAVVVGYIGNETAEVEEDFQVIGAANQAEGWKTYSLSSEVHTGSSGDVHVALGISVRWETQMTYFIDNVDIAIN